MPSSSGPSKRIASPRRRRSSRALAATGRPIVAVALRTPWDCATYPAGVPAVCTYSILPDPLEALARALGGRDRLPGPVARSRCDPPRRDPRAARGRGPLPRRPGRHRRVDRRRPPRPTAAPRRHRRARDLGQRRHLRPVRARGPASDPGRARDAVDRVGLRRRARLRRHARHRDQPVGRVARHRVGGRGRGGAGCAHARDHELTRFGPGAGRGSDDRPRRRAGARGRGDQDLHRGTARDRGACRRPWPTTRPTVPPSQPSRRPLAAVLELEPDLRRIAADQAAATRALVIARGFEYATAREWALKLKELALVFADPYSSADFQHGPLALVEPGVPVLAVARNGVTAAALVTLIDRLRVDLGAEVMVVSDATAALADATWPVRLPGRDARMARPDRLDRRGPAPRAAPDRGSRPRSGTAPEPAQGDPHHVAPSLPTSPGSRRPRHLKRGQT